jgi:hypothetical protein
MRVRGAAQVLQERCVQHSSELGVGATGSTPEPGGNHCTLQRLLERRTGAHVGDDRQAAQQAQQAEHPISLTLSPAAGKVTGSDHHLASRRRDRPRQLGPTRQVLVHPSGAGPAFGNGPDDE